MLNELLPTGVHLCFGAMEGTQMASAQQAAYFMDQGNHGMHFHN